MSLDAQSTSFIVDTKDRNNDLCNVPDIKAQNEAIVNKILNPLDVENYVNKTLEFSKQIETALQPSDVSNFQKSLENTLPKEVYNKIKNLTPAEIAEIMATIVICGALVATGVGIIPVLAGIATRVGIRSIAYRLAFKAMERPIETSIVMGFIPGMKQLAPNQSVAMSANITKDIIVNAIPMITAQIKKI